MLGQVVSGVYGSRGRLHKGWFTFVSIAQQTWSVSPPLTRSSWSPPTLVPAAPTMGRTATSISRSSVFVVLPLRIFLAAGWMRAGVEKLIDPRWWNGVNLRVFLTAHHQLALPFFRPVMEHAIAPFAVPITFVVMATQIACGIAIAVGRPLRAALRWGLVLNVVFVLCGQVNPSAFYLIMEIGLLFAIAEGTIGRRPSVPSRITTVCAALSLMVGLGMLPFIRTMKPADVIADPAIMIAFLAFITAATLALRRAVAGSPTRSSTAARGLAQRLSSWATAQPASD